MQGSSKIANRYAKAITGGVSDPKKVRLVMDELSNFAGVMAGSSELELVLTSDLFSEEDRQNVLKDLVEKMKLSDETRRTLALILEAKRMKYLKDIARAVHLNLLEASNVVPLLVQAANDLSADEKKKIESKFSTILGKDVEASYEVEPSLIGGVRVTASGRTYDGSIAGSLNTFEEQLVGGNI